MIKDVLYTSEDGLYVETVIVEMEYGRIVKCTNDGVNEMLRIERYADNYTCGAYTWGSAMQAAADLLVKDIDKSRDAAISEWILGLQEQHQSYDMDALFQEASIHYNYDDLDGLYSEKYTNVTDQYRDFDIDPDRQERELDQRPAHPYDCTCDECAAAIEHEVQQAQVNYDLDINEHPF